MLLQNVITEIDFYSIQSNNPEDLKIPIEEITILIQEPFKELERIHAGLIGIITMSNISRLDDRGELYHLVGGVEEHVSKGNHGIYIRMYTSYSCHIY